MNEIQIGKGHVFHSRKDEKVKSFRYPSFFMFFRCDQESLLKNIFRKKYFQFMTFRARDYLDGRVGSLDANIKSFLNEFCGYQADEVWLHTLPRMLGYAFNPVSFWICRRQNRPEAVLVEVHNTFGERHFYWIFPKEEITAATWFRAEKVFHVSPFLPLDGHYKFRFQVVEKECRIDIHYYSDEDQLRLVTWVTGKLEDLQNQKLFSIFLTYGWMTLFVIFRIHYQAFKLFLKNFKFYSKPALPRRKVSS